MRIEKDKAVFILIDVQEKLFPHMYEKDNLLLSMVKLIKGFEILGIPGFITEQYSKGLGDTIQPIKSIIKNKAPFEKMSFSCCDESHVMTALRNLNRKFVLIAGIEAHVCVQQTVTDLARDGFQPVVVADCISSRKENDKIIAMERMRKEGAIITSCESLLLEVCRVAGSDEFKAISALIK